MKDKLTMIDSGYEVVGSDGKKIGTIKECTDLFCHIDTGFLGLGPDYYVPRDAIQDVSAGQVFLNVPSDQVGHMGWDQKPSESEQRDYEAAAPSFPSGDYDRAPTDEARAPYDTSQSMPPYQEDRMPEDRSRSVPLEEEELRAHKEQRTRGEVEIGKRVEEEQKSIDVPVSHEEAVIRERPVDQPTDKPIGEGETIRVPLREERAVPEKESHVYGEVDVEKRQVTEPRQFSDTVRKEVPEVHKKGDVDEVVDEEGDLPEDTDREDKAA